MAFCTSGFRLFARVDVLRSCALRSRQRNIRPECNSLLAHTRSTAISQTPFTIFEGMDSIYSAVIIKECCYIAQAWDGVMGEKPHFLKASTSLS